jgi:hypothetical protein
MNESDFEVELRKLQPAAPSRKLAEGIARELASITRAADLRLEIHPRAHIAKEEARIPWLTRWLDRLLWSGLGATAVLALTLSQQTPTPAVAQSSRQPVQSAPRASSPQDSSLLQPVLASEEDLGWHDDGVHFDPHGQPMLRLTRTAVKRQAWADLKNAGVVQMETPRQEVMWVPVALH